jgi:hypothetical protein
LPLRERILARIAERAAESRYPLTPQRIVHDVRQVMPEDGIVCLDNLGYPRKSGSQRTLRWRGQSRANPSQKVKLDSGGVLE